MSLLIRGFDKPQIPTQPECYPLLTMIHLDLQPEVEARLAMQAQARGLALERYLKDLMTAQAGEPRPESPAQAVAQIRELRKGLSLGGLSIKELINEGRRVPHISLLRCGFRRATNPHPTECYPLLTMIHLDLQPEVEAQLAAEAQARGLSLDQYVESIVTDHSREASGTDTFYSSDQKLSEQQLAENLRQGLAEIAEGRTRPAEEVFAELHRQYGIQG